MSEERWEWMILGCLFLASTVSYVGVYNLGRSHGEQAALKRAYKVYTQQIWNEHPEVIKERGKKKRRRA